jgi:hypothetical protein
VDNQLVLIMLINEDKENKIELSKLVEGLRAKKQTEREE